MGNAFITDLVYNLYIVKIGDREMLTDLIILSFDDFDVILGMD